MSLLSVLYWVSEDAGVEAKASKNDKRDYPEIEQAFVEKGLNYYWKSYDTTTADGYDLTLFRVLGNARRRNIPNQWSKGVVLLLHGFSKDAYAWTDYSRGDTDLPFLPTRLFEEGYDVWLGSVRGTRYSIGHSRLDANRQAE